MITPKPTTDHKRWALWLPLLAASGYLAFGEAPNSQDPSEQVIRPAVRKLPLPESTTNDVKLDDPSTRSLALKPRDALYPKGGKRQPDKDIFAATDWTPPPPPPPAKMAPPPPMAPALPFSFLGKRNTENAWEVFLNKGDVTYLVREGQTFADHYRVEKIQPPQMTLIYLPLSQTQTLSVGESR